MLEIIYNDANRVINSLDFSKLKDKKVLITGSTGLIGLHIVASLVELKKKYNLEIYCWINSSIDKKINSLFENCNIIKGDLTNAKFVENINDKFDIIIHSAGYAQPQKFTENKLNTIRLNTEAIINLFNLLNKNGTFVFASTSEIYSGLSKENILESEIGTTTPDHPRACYIESKRCGETICHAFKDKGFDVKIARISLAYGPGTRLNDTRVMHNIIDKALLDGQVTLLDSGSSIRTYCYVSDVVEMLWNITLHGKEIVYNIGGISKISIKELANNISTKLNANLTIPENDNQGLSGNPKLVNIGLEKYMKEFNKNNFVGIDDGIKNTIDWQKYNLQ